MVGKRKSPRHVPGSPVAEDDPHVEMEEVDGAEAHDEVEPVKENEAPEEVLYVEEDEAAEMELDLTKKDDFRKGRAFSAMYRKLIKELQATEDDGDDDKEAYEAIGTWSRTAPSFRPQSCRRRRCRTRRAALRRERRRTPRSREERGLAWRAQEKGIALVGSAVTLRWPDDDLVYAALIIGYRASDDTFKVYFWEKGEVSEDLTRDVIQFNSNKKIQKEGLVGARIFRRFKIKGNNSLCEAFVVHKNEDGSHHMIRPHNDRRFNRDMHVHSEKWGLLENGKLNVDGSQMELNTWCNY